MRALLALAFALLIYPVNARAEFFVVDKVADYSAAALQQTEVWCWAASIETVFRTAGVSWSQKDIVTAVKGFPAFSTANAGEMSLFLNGFGFDYDGSTWKGESEYFNRALN